jgi:diguanylate cyclase
MNRSEHHKIEEKYQNIFDFASESLFIIDPETEDILHANNNACYIYGYTYDEILKMKVVDISAEQFQINETLNNTHDEHMIIPIRYHKKKDGSVFPVEIQTSLFTIKNQKVFMCVVKNMSEIRQDEEVLKQQMKDLLETQRIAHIGTWRLNVLTNEVVWSKELYKMYGFDSTLPVPPYTEHMKLFTPESWDMLSSSLELTRTIGIPYELELKTVMIDGSNGWMWVRGEAEKDAEGNIIAIWGAAQDITQRKKAEERIRLSENRFKEVVQNLNAGVVIHAADSSVLDCNDRASKLLGLSVEQIIGKVAIDLAWTFVDEDEAMLPHHKYPINLVLTTKKPLENYLVGVYHSKNNSITWLMVNGTLLLNDAGDVSEVVISFIDFTDVKNSKDQIQASEEQYRLLTTEMQLGQALHEIICDDLGNPVDYRFISVNNAFEQLTGIRKEDIIGKTVLQVIPNTEKYWIEKYGVVALTGESTQFENYASELNRHYSVSAYSPRIGQFAVIIDDITDKKRMEQQLNTEKELFKTTLISVGDGVISTDTQGNVQIMNKVSEQLTGWTQEEAIGKPIEEIFNIINEFTRERFDNPVLKVLSSHESIQLDNHTLLISKDGIERAIEDSASPIIDENGNIAGVVLVFRDFTGKKKSLNEIKYLSFHDYLTGLYNRRFYETEMTRLDTQRNWPLTIVLGDVNGLKLINDSFGHALGDKLLKKVSEAIQKGCRADDIIARMGGDEFAILLPRTDGAEAAQLIKRIKELLKNETIEGIEVSVSFGFATKMTSDDDTETVFKKAEDTMYHNKLFEGPSIKGRVIDNIIESLNNKSKREEIHSRHVSDLCQRMGEALGLEELKIKELKVFGLLHDIGKIAISDKILNKAEKLDDIEWVEMKSHAETGYRILSTNLDMKEIAEYVLAHHERWDGLGYPKGLKGREIPLPARICSIVDAYDAMISIRSYKSSLGKEVALNELRMNIGTQFDPELVSVFIEKVLGEK